MRVKAMVNFTGTVTMTKGEEKLINEREVYEDLINAGYVEEIKEVEVEEVKEETPKTKNKVSKK